jgi:glycosyltransferase involved in cell wall biosynthesis
VRKFVFVSHDSQRTFGCKASAARGIVIYDAVDVDDTQGGSEPQNVIRSEFGIPADAAVVGTLGHIAPAKDYETLVRAAARVVESGAHVRFLIVGDHSSQSTFREHYQKVRALVEGMQLGGHFIFTGFRRDVSRMLRAMDILVLSTNTEGLPLSILEAMAHRKPVIATRVGGIPEIVSDGVTGLLHPHKDDAALAHQIISLLADPGRASRLASEAQAFVRTHFLKDRFASQMLDVYASMVPALREQQMLNRR